MRALHRLGLALAASMLLAGPSAAQTTDHLECYKIKDPLRLKGPREPWLDLEGPQFGREGCRIAGKLRLFCAPVEKTVTAPLLRKIGKEPFAPFDPVPVPGPGQVDQVCYRIKCPRPGIPPQRIVDQFGERTVEGFKPFLVCGPAAKLCELPDLVVRLVNPPTLVSCPGGQGTCVHDVDVEVENVGTADAGPFEVSVSTDNGLAGNVPVAGLAAGATTAFTANLGPGNNCFDPDCQVTAVADPTGAVEECVEDDNDDTRLDLG